MKEKIKVVFEYCRVNGISIFLMESASRFLSKVRAAFYRKMFLGRVGSIGPSPYIRGLRYIKMGSGFRCSRRLWLEALRPADASADPLIEVGNNVSLSDDVHISCISSIRIGNNALIGSRVYIGDHNHGNYSDVFGLASHCDSAPANRRLSSDGPLSIGENVWIGDGVVIIGPVSIGDGSVIAANSVVTSNIPAGSIAAGAPARTIKSYDRLTGVWRRTMRIK